MPESKGERKKTRHKLQNSVREKGLSPPNRQVKEFEEGDHVHVRIDPSIPDGRPSPKYQGMTGVVEGKQGRAYKIRVRDGEKQKTLISLPAHLKNQE